MASSLGTYHSLLSIHYGINTVHIHAHSMYPLYYRKHSAAVNASTCLAPDAIPMDANPSYEEVHVYEHIDKKDSKQ